MVRPRLFGVLLFLDLGQALQGESVYFLSRELLAPRFPHTGFRQGLEFPPVKPDEVTTRADVDLLCQASGVN
jgi:hypothetical protein